MILSFNKHCFKTLFMVLLVHSTVLGKNYGCQDLLCFQGKLEIYSKTILLWTRLYISRPAKVLKVDWGLLAQRFYLSCFK